MKKIIYFLMIFMMTARIAMAATKDIVPRADGEGSIGTSIYSWSGADINTVTVNTTMTVGGTTVCLSDGTSCPAAGGGLVAADIDTSAELKAIVTDETGTGGALVFATAPTLSSPVIQTLRTSDGGQIIDENSNQLLFWSVTASAVNEFTIKNAATGNAPQLQATGGDTDVSIALVPKGAGRVTISTDLTITGDDLFMATNTDRFVLMADGTNYNPEAINLATDTTGDFVNSVTGGDGIDSTGATSGENISHTLAVALKTVAENAVGTTNSVSGLEFESAELTMLQGCSDGQIVKWEEDDDKWHCAADSGGAETNSLEVIATGIATTEIPIGTAADTVVYAALSGDVTMTNGGVVTVADNSHTHDATTLSTDSVSADELNATGVEAELEAALDIAGEVSSTGMASTVIADSVAVTSWNLTTPTVTTSLTYGSTVIFSGGDTFSLDNVDAINSTTETTIEAQVFDADAKTITGIWEVQDDVDFAFGNDADWLIQYDEGVDNQLLFITANTSAIATTDPMVEFLVGTTPTADQQVFGVAKGTQATNTALLTVDEDGDMVAAGSGTFTGTGGISTSGTMLFTGTSSVGWVAVDGTDNVACNTTCFRGCIFGVQNATGTAVTGIVSCSDATADTCFCGGGS